MCCVGVVFLFVAYVFNDSRGVFLERVNNKAFDKENRQQRGFVHGHQHQSSERGRAGVHFPRLRPLGGGVGGVRGAVFDVAVDIRRSSPTFGKWVGSELSEDNHKQMWVPPGLAHGFLVLSESADFLYKTTDYYAPAHERCIAWNDESLAIAWPDIG